MQTTILCRCGLEFSLLFLTFAVLSSRTITWARESLERWTTTGCNSMALTFQCLKRTLIVVSIDLISDIKMFISQTFFDRTLSGRVTQFREAFTTTMIDAA